MPARVFRAAQLRSPQRLIDIDYCKAATAHPESWRALVGQGGILEIFCHPGTELADQEKAGQLRSLRRTGVPAVSRSAPAAGRWRFAPRQLLEHLIVRILMIIPQVFYSTRGTPISAYHRCRELIAHGHEVDILTYKPGADAPDLKARIYRSHGPHFAKLIISGPSRIKIWFDLLLLINLFYRLTVRRYDALYAHEEGAFLARIVGGIFRTPYVYDMHSSLPRQIREWGFSKKQWVVSLFSWVERVSVRGARRRRGDFAGRRAGRACREAGCLGGCDRQSLRPAARIRCPDRRSRSGATWHRADDPSGRVHRFVRRPAGAGHVDRSRSPGPRSGCPTSNSCWWAARAKKSLP